VSNLLVPAGVAKATTSDELGMLRDRATSWRADTVAMQAHRITETALADLSAAAKAAGDARFGRVVDAIIASRAGEDKPIPSFGAAPEMLRAYLKREMIDGWLYMREPDGYLQPYLVTGIRTVEARNPSDVLRVQITMTADKPFTSDGRRSEADVKLSRSLFFDASDLTKKRPAQVLLNAGAIKETAELRADYLERHQAFHTIMQEGFTEQYRYTGTPHPAGDYFRNGEGARRENRKVVHDVAPDELHALRGEAPSELAEEDDTLPVPVLPRIRVFDLTSHTYLVANASDLVRHQYDASLRDKLVLPADQRELLDVLTSDIGAFTGDLIEGKSAGNVILAKGLPGVGKTLTAEVYAELVQRPLYSIHSGTLGVSADTVRERLEEVFTRAQRWNAVLLLDEADVFVLRRGDNLAANAVCAEFLRTLEYFDGLLFMTTNRSDDIDDAIISRCAALIDYRVPDENDARRIWQVLAAGHGVVLEEALLDALLAGLAGISPRDIKMLLRLALRMAGARGEELTPEVFARCATFRGLHFETTALETLGV